MLAELYPPELEAGRVPFSTDQAEQAVAKRQRVLRDPAGPHVQRNARGAVAVAKRKRELIVENCGRCGAEPEMSRDGSRVLMHAHHLDYTKPLEVVWLCWRCHAVEHRSTIESE